MHHSGFGLLLRTAHVLTGTRRSPARDVVHAPRLEARQLEGGSVGVVFGEAEGGAQDVDEDGGEVGM